MKLVVVSGLSGAGKSVALKQYEDLGWYCIDNLPLDLVEPLIGHALEGSKGRYDRMAIGVDARAPQEEIAQFPLFLQTLRQRGVHVDVLFLVAEQNVLLKRYADTRRKHPLSGHEVSLVEAIAMEHRHLQPIADIADTVLDTSSLNLHELREALQQRMPEGAKGGMSVLFLSFGFKNGVPSGADYMFDLRCLPNPHWVPDLRPLTGRDAAVQAWFDRQHDVLAMMRDVQHFLGNWLPRVQETDRAYLTVALGCTGGQHRSVYFAERLGRRFRSQFPEVLIKHRELP